MLNTNEYIKAIHADLVNTGIAVTSQESANGKEPDLMFENRQGELIAVEFKNAKSYGQLPLSTAVQVKGLKEKYPNLVLISLSDIPQPLSDSLNSMGVVQLAKPSIKDAKMVLRKMVTSQFIDILAACRV